MADTISFLSPISRLVPAGLAEFLPIDAATQAEIDSKVFYTDFNVLKGGGRVGFEITIVIAEELSIELPWLEGTALVFGAAAGHGMTSFRASIAVGEGTFNFGVSEIELALRLPPTILKPAPAEAGQTAPPFAQIAIKGSFSIDQSLNFRLHGFDRASLSPVMIGDSGVIISADGVMLDLSPTETIPEVLAAGFDESFVGVFIGEARVRLPEGLPALAPEELILRKAAIGTGGVSGTLSADYTDNPATYDPRTKSFTGRGASELFGVPFALTSVEIKFKQNALVASRIAGKLLLPFFDEPTDVEIALGLDGSLAVKLSATGGLLTLTKPDLLSVTIESLGFDITGGKLTVRLSGSITPLALGANAPSFAVRELSIDSEGHVRLEGGWLTLPKQLALDFFGFKLEITKIGFGTTDTGKKWVGFSGGLKLIDALPAGASVEGLRLTWDEELLRTDPSKAFTFSLNGVGVEFEVPGVVKFKGAISFADPVDTEVFDNAGQSLGMERVQRFDGAITLELTAVNLRIDAVLVVGSATGVRGNYSFFAIYLSAQLPAGIPLAATGLGLYGVAGLFALSMEPNRKRDEKWYGVGPNDGWYKRNGIIGVTDLKTKWDPNPAALAFGAGVTIGTVADNGFTFAGSVLLVIVIPGPIIMLEGKANLLKERATLTEDPLFRMLAVLDGRAGNITLGLDVHYRNGKGGDLIDIRAGVEAYFDFHDADAWHLYLGEREPRERRIRADIFKLFRAEGYFMVDSRRLQTGAWVGFDNRWSFGPLQVTLEAWLEGNALLSFKPLQFHGDVWLHGNIGASVFGFGFSLVADAKCDADVFKPFHLLFDLHVKLDLPWPAPDFAADLTFEYGPIPDPPPLPLPLKEIAVEHFKVTTKWPLPRKVATPLLPLLLPNYDSDDDGFRNPSVPVLNDPVPVAAAFLPANIPVVPLDARPLLTFGRSVHDVGMVGGNAAPVLQNSDPKGWEWLGDPALNQGAARAQYRLIRVALEKHVGTASWKLVACRPKTAGVDVDELYGSWAPVPHIPSGNITPVAEPPIANVKLWLWSKSPFDFTRQTGRAWDEWFTDRFPSYPCVPPPPDRTLCCNFEAMPVGTTLTSPWTCPDHPEITLTWTAGAVGTVTTLPTPIGGHKRALCFPGSISSTGGGGVGTTTPVVVTVTLPAGGKGVDVLVRDPHGDPGAGDPDGRTPVAVLTCVGFAGLRPGSGPNPRVERGISFGALTPRGAPAGETRLVSSPEGTAFDCAFGLDISLPCEAERVVLTLVHSGTPARVTAIARDGSPVRSITMSVPSGTPERLVVAGRGIVRVVVEAPNDETRLLELCYACPPTVTITGTDGRGGVVGGTGDGATTTVAPAGGRVLTVTGPALSTADVSGTAGVCIAEVCVSLAPNPVDVLRHEQMTEHMAAELTRWSQTGEVLEPNTIYRLHVETEIEVKDWAWESPPAPFGGLATPYDGMRTQTEYAYFRTEGPPGLTQLALPLGTADATNFDSGLEDLTRYVEQTVPATVPGPGEKPPLPRPVYRAYDVGVRFNEDYVDLMYRASQRDLGLYLYDNNDQPVRDVSGRLIVLENHWGTAESRTLSEAEKHWVATVNESSCARLDETTFPPDRTLTAGDGTVLDADTVYEGRLVPLLLHDDFSAERAGWETPIDQGTAAGPSAWTTKYHATLAGSAATASQSVVTLSGSPDLSAIDTAFDVITLAADTARASKRYRITAVDNATKNVTVQGTPALTGGTSSWDIPSLGAVVQTSAIAGGTAAGNDPEKPGTMLVRGDPATWTDYRFSVLLRNSAASGSGAPGAVGVLFRAKDATNYYRFSMDQSRRYRRLVRVANGTHTILAADDVAYASNSDYHVTVEAVGDLLRVYLDGALVFDVHDRTHDRGRVGLYTWGTGGARFSDVRVDDFRRGVAPIVYRFKFTTSKFVNFFHHLHSYQDESWRALGDVSAHAAKAKATSIAPTDQEWRDYEVLASAVLGSAASQTPPQMEVTRLDDNGAQGFLVRSPEPIDWKRTSLQLSRSAGVLARPRVPQEVKLTAAAFGAVYPNEESATLLLRHATNLSGYQIERRVLPAAVAEPSVDAGYFADAFDGGERGLLFDEDFGPNALDHYTTADEEAPGLTAAKSIWAVSGGHIVQTANYMGGGSTEAGAEKPGTFAVVKGASWSNVRASATVRSEDYDDIGVVFRFQDDLNYYRFSLSQFGIYRRLAKRVGGAWTVLWEDLQRGHIVGQTYRVTIEAYRDRLVGYLDDALLFSVRDEEFATGSVGFYCWRNTNAHFEALQVESLEAPTVLWQPAFASLEDVVTIDEGTIGGPSAWSANAGTLQQTASVTSTMFFGSILFPGTYALGGDERWEDVLVSARLRSDAAGSIGVMFRYRDARNYYRFAMDRTHQFRRLIRVVNGVTTTFWDDAVQYTVGTTYQLSIRAVGSELRGSLDGAPLFTVYDGALLRGRVALYCENNHGARFEQVVVTDRSRSVGNWVVHDEGTTGAPSAWRLADGALAQSAAIGGGTAPDAPGTLVVAGNPAWTDYRLRVRLRSDSDGAIGVVFRCVDANNYYRLSLDAQLKEGCLIRRLGGVTESLWLKSDGFPVGETMEITVDAVGSRLVGYLGGTKLFDVVDASHPAGRVGVYTWNNPAARFEHVEVRRPPLEAYALYRDSFLADSRTGWTIVDEGMVDTPSQWQVIDGTLRQKRKTHSEPVDRDTLDKPGTYALAGDPAWRDLILAVRLGSPTGSGIGVMFGYEDADNYYRFSMDRVRGYRRLVRKLAGTFYRLWEDSVLYNQARTYELTVLAEGAWIRGFIDGVPLFAVSSDPVKGRIALYSWNNADAGFSHVIVYPARLAFRGWVLDETFMSQTPPPWTVVDDGTQDGPSSWVLTDSLLQFSGIYGGNTSATAPEKPGTHIVGGSPDWRDFRLAVRLISGDPNAIGVMFRYGDNDNYYRFSMDRALSYRRLIKKVGGTVTVLWEDTVPYEIDHEYIVTVDCVGDVLRGYLDGVPLFAVVDASHERGRIGAYTWKNARAAFREFRVGAPSWAEYYAFGSEAVAPAGTRLRVHAGNAAQPAPEEWGVKRRFAASFDEWGRLTLAPTAELRVRAPGDDAGHARGFLRDSEYTPVPTRVLRRADETGKADGTGFALFPATLASTFTEGQYRLRLEFRRNNQASDPESTVLRQAAHDTPELVEIDIPWQTS